jgi:phosphatidylinositol alpha-mannosyltransferase
VRIVQACPYSWDAPGGVQVHVRDLSEELRSRGHQVLILAPGDRPRSDPGIQIVGRPVRIGYQGTVAPLCFTPASFVAVRQGLGAFRPDVIHAHEPLVPSTSMFAILASGRAATVGTFHAYSESSELFDKTKSFVRPVWKRLRQRIAVSNAAADFVRSRMLTGDVEIVPNGVDVARFAAAMGPPEGLPEGRLVLWVGRLDPQKGFPVALAAFAEVARDHGDLRFLVVGDGADRTAVGMQPEDVRRKVTMLGMVPNERLAPYYAAADAYLNGAVGQESFGLVLVEAMAAGAPVVATDIPCYRDVVNDGETGLLAPPNDPHALAGALRRVLDDPALADRLREAGRERAATFAWPRVADRIEEAYERARRDTI